MMAPFSRSMFDLLCEQAHIDPDRDAAVTVEGCVSYRELLDRARRVAGYLHETGVRRGDPVGLLCDNRSAWLEIFFGIAALGGVVVPFSTWSTASELGFLFEDLRIKMLFTIDRFGARNFGSDIAALRASPSMFPSPPRTDAGGPEGRFDHLQSVVMIDGQGSGGASSYDEVLSAEPIGHLVPGEAVSASDPLMVLYTSGSSSRPKAVPLDHFATIENGFNIGERQGLRREDRVLVSVPLFWAYGAVNALPAVISHGATLVLQSHFEAGGALDLINNEKCTGIYTLPAITNALLAHPAFRPERTASLRTGVTIGSPQDVLKAAEMLGAREICNIYGQTESYGNCCVTPHDWPLEQRAACQGPPLPGVSVRVRHVETGAFAAAGEVGHIEVKGYLTRGYAADSARFNAETFTADGYFKTGDLGALDAAGHMRFAGRSSEMIKRSGINVSPSEVEEVLQRHPAIGLAGVAGVPDEARGEIIVAYVTAMAGEIVDADDVLAFCREHLSRYKVPDKLVIAEALPLTVTGKVMRRALQAMAKDGHGCENAP